VASELAAPASDVVRPATAGDGAGVREGVGSSNGALRLGRYRSIWASPEVEISPALLFTVARQQVELSPDDARRLGIGDGDLIDVSQNGTRLRGTAHVRSGVPAGTAFLADGIAADSANALTESVVEVQKP
jgi:NADH-quinone oxidoreductase subunit G